MTDSDSDLSSSYELKIYEESLSPIIPESQDHNPVEAVAASPSSIETSKEKLDSNLDVDKKLPNFYRELFSPPGSPRTETTETKTLSRPETKSEVCKENTPPPYGTTTPSLLSPLPPTPILQRHPPVISSDSKIVLKNLEELGKNTSINLSEALTTISSKQSVSEPTQVPSGSSVSEPGPVPSGSGALLGAVPKNKEVKVNPNDDSVSLSTKLDAAFKGKDCSFLGVTKNPLDGAGNKTRDEKNKDGAKMSATSETENTKDGVKTASTKTENTTDGAEHTCGTNTINSDDSPIIRMIINFEDEKDRLVQFIRITKNYTIEELLGFVRLDPIPVTEENCVITVNPKPFIHFRVVFKDSLGFYQPKNLNKPTKPKEPKEKRVKTPKPPKEKPKKPPKKPDKPLKNPKNEAKKKLKEVAPELFEIPALSKLMKELKPEMIEEALKPVPPEPKYLGIFKTDSKKDSKTNPTPGPSKSGTQVNPKTGPQSNPKPGPSSSSQFSSNPKNIFPKKPENKEPNNQKLKSRKRSFIEEGQKDPNPTPNLNPNSGPSSTPNKNLFTEELPPGTFADTQPTRYPNLGPDWYRKGLYPERDIPLEQLLEVLPSCGKPNCACGEPFDSSEYKDQMIYCAGCNCRIHYPDSESSAEELSSDDDDDSISSESSGFSWLDFTSSEEEEEEAGG